ncbi:MAG: tRNA (guanosine(37)-N1)-methyltransferase TrmD [Bacillota bacterium]
MRFDILTLFPEMFAPVINNSMLAKAQEKDLLEINLINWRDYAEDKHQQVDDYSYGGGAGMVLKPEPVFKAVDDLDLPSGTPVILLTPQGQQFDQRKAKEFVESYERIVLLCGHYEGFDHRIREQLVTHELSLGDYVLTGGELPAMVLVDAVTRLIPGVVGNQDSVQEDSFYKGLLDYPHYTRPQEYRGLEVPAVLLSGDHAKIDKWRKKKSLEQTLNTRPDLLEDAELSAAEKELLAEIKAEKKTD